MEYLRGSDDDTLLAMLKRDDEKAFEALYERYWDGLYSKAYYKTGSSAEAEDLVHEIFSDLWKNRKKIEIRKSFAAYIATAMKYKIFRLIDAKAVRQRYAEQHAREIVLTTDNTEELLSFNELYEQIEEKIESLPDKCRTVFRLSRNESKSIKEIAQQLAISTSTAQNHISHALKHLRVELKDYL